MMRVSHALAELANIAPNTHQAYVGSSAFSHKAGLHASAIKVDPELYNHLDPTRVGNDMHILITEMAGRASVELKARELGVDLSGRPEAVGRIVDTVKSREAGGWSYEAADASFELLIRDELAADHPEEAAPKAFQLESYRVIVEKTGSPVPTVTSEATVKVHVGGRRIIATAEGNGPVNALDSALRSAVAEEFPEFNQVELVDYKVRILAGSAGTDSITRVLVSSARGAQEWTTVGVHANVVEASWQALVDALVYALQPHLARTRRKLYPGENCRSDASARPRGPPDRRFEPLQRGKGTDNASGQDRPPRRRRVRHRRRPRRRRDGAGDRGPSLRHPDLHRPFLAAGRHSPAGADPAVEGGRDRPELRRSRRRAGQRGPHLADHLHQAVHLGDRPAGRDPAAGVLASGSISRANSPW